uniref:Uncharacterized protein n=1 Tax=Ananas comosus var. bracteatus TaxID=296719 RepID=A0A6V7PRI4_ANACO|nr:unnamed protein product [Ananas comosus var. bracteatus]
MELKFKFFEPKLLTNAAYAWLGRREGSDESFDLGLELESVVSNEVDIGSRAGQRKTEGVSTNQLSQKYVLTGRAHPLHIKAQSQCLRVSTRLKLSKHWVYCWASCR